MGLKTTATATKILMLEKEATERINKSLKEIKPDYLMFSLRFKVILKKFYGVKLTREEQKIFEQMEREYEAGD